MNDHLSGHIDPQAPHRAAGDALIGRLRAMGELPDELDRAAEERLREDASVVADAAVRVERQRISRNLAIAVLWALRTIPSGRIQNGCVITDGATVRERLRAAYRGITADPGTPADGSPADQAQPLDIRAALACAVDEIADLPRELSPDGTLTEEQAYRLADHYAGIAAGLHEKRRARHDAEVRRINDLEAGQ